VAIVAAGKAIGEDDRRGEAAGFVGVDRRRDEDDVLSFVDQLLALVGGAEPRVHEPALDLPIMIEIGEGARVGDEGDDERAAERRLAERSDADARTRLVEGGEVVDDLLPAWQMAIGTGLEAEDGGGSRNRALGDGRRRGGEEERGSDEE